MVKTNAMMKRWWALFCVVALSACNPSSPTPSPSPSPSPRAATPTPAPIRTAPTAIPTVPDDQFPAFVVPGRKFAPIDPFEQAKRLGRGVNFANALEAPNEGDWGVVLREEYFAFVRELGFDTVRVPIRWSAHALREPPYSISPKFFERVDWVIKNALAQDLNVVINVHHYEELFEDVQGERERFLALWNQIARRYRKLPAEVVFEVLNEPHGKLTPGLWQRLFEEALTVIRSTNPQRNVVFTGANWGTLNALLGSKPPADPHLIATFHYYEPIAFTHQGAEWTEGSNAWIGTKWLGTGTQRAQVEFDFDRVVRWAEANKVPLWMGEFGAYGRYADLESRVRWTEHVARTAEARGISWAYWEFGSGFGFYDIANRQWSEPLIKALLP
ncbi:MAG: endoglucanase [Candidatus Roseilinea sp.]|nr:MAG: endoglucanase [Candidatus Roseilinea sp.]